jgi:hypothetical protein
MNGVYLGQDPEKIRATLEFLRHYQTFIRSGCERMRDPLSAFGADTITQEETQRKLTWLIDLAINRKAGIPDHAEDMEVRRLAWKVNQPRLIVREHECPPRYRRRLAHRFWKEDDV